MNDDITSIGMGIVGADGKQVVGVEKERGGK